MALANTFEYAALDVLNVDPAYVVQRQGDIGFKATLCITLVQLPDLRLHHILVSRNQVDLVLEPGASLFLKYLVFEVNQCPCLGSLERDDGILKRVEHLLVLLFRQLLRLPLGITNHLARLEKYVRVDSPKAIQAVAHQDQVKQHADERGPIVKDSESRRDLVNKNNHERE